MPKIVSSTTQAQLKNYISLSYELLAQAWFIKAGLVVEKITADFGDKTDLVVFDRRKSYRIQIKSITATTENILVKNQWAGADIDYVIYFNKLDEWGYIVPAFEEGQRRLNSRDHIRFHQHPKNFIKAFLKA